MVDMHFNKVRFNVFYLIVKRVVTNFKRPIKHLIKLYLHENDVKLLKCKWSPIKFDLWYVWSVRFWSWIPEINTSSKAMESLTCFSLVNLILGSFLFNQMTLRIYWCSSTDIIWYNFLYLFNGFHICYVNNIIQTVKQYLSIMVLVDWGNITTSLINKGN